MNLPQMISLAFLMIAVGFMIATAANMRKRR
jgi:hypothetical protein